jgi:hypothetical protein
MMDSQEEKQSNFPIFVVQDTDAGHSLAVKLAEVRRPCEFVFLDYDEYSEFLFMKTITKQGVK